MEIYQLTALQDNYVYCMRDPSSGQTAVIDPSEARPVLRFLSEKNWKLDYVLNTHHHWDHVGGNLVLKEKTGCRIVGYFGDKHRIPGIDTDLDEGATTLLNQCVEVLFIPGHTLGHIAYWFKDEDALFCGDTLFTLGCGRLFEGSPQMMWKSLDQIRSLPPSTRIFCGHEYTQINGRFALMIDPDNGKLHQRMERVNELRAQGEPTVPSLLGEELETNPFIRPQHLRARLGMADQGDDQVFAEIRRQKDQF